MKMVYKTLTKQQIMMYNNVVDNNNHQQQINKIKTNGDKIILLKKLFICDLFMIDPFIEIYDKPIYARFWI